MLPVPINAVIQFSSVKGSISFSALALITSLLSKFENYKPRQTESLKTRELRVKNVKHLIK